MSGTASALGTRLGARLGTSVGIEGDPNLNTILSILGAQSVGVFFDPAYDAGVDLADDSGTERCTGIDSQPIPGQTQYTVLSPSVPAGGATFASPNGRRLLVGAGAQYLSGAAGLAAQFTGTTAFTAVTLGSRSASSTMMMWCFGHSSLDNRISQHHAAAGTADSRLRTQAGATTNNTPGSVLPLATVRTLSMTFSGSAISTWLDGVISLNAAANTRAPAALDTMVIGAQLSAGVVNSHWQGIFGPVAICSGVLSTPNRQALEHAVGAYYGYPF